jgi:putative SOS response-associated peptidase YedK
MRNAEEILKQLLPLLKSADLPPSYNVAPHEALAWINPAIDDKEKLTALLRQFDSKKMKCYAANTGVGNLRNNSPDCIATI